LDAPAPYQLLIGKLRALGPGSLIGVEGFCSSGKSRLADRLALDMDADVIHTDDYALKFDEPPTYVDCLKLEELAGAISRRSGNKRTFIEGIYLRDVLSRCNADVELFFYVRRIGQNGLWYDELHLESFEHGEAEEGDEIEPHLSDLKYHSRTRPHEKADIVFDRIED
jgi:hypothetical protein